MSYYSGPQYKGAAKDRRATKRAEAEERNARTPEENRRANREAKE